MLPLEDERYPNRGMWIFAGSFFAIMLSGVFFHSVNPYNVAKIYFTLDQYQAVSFTAQRVVEEIRTRKRISRTVARNLIGVINVTPSKSVQTEVLTQRQVEIAFRIPDANIPQLGELTLQKPITVLFNPKIKPYHFGDESLVLIASDRGAHLSVFVWSMVKLTCVLLWFSFCAYMWATYPNRHQKRLQKALSKEFETRRINRAHHI
jgi:hypothetical protein